MAWPLPSEFVPMLQNPGIGFRDPELKQCVIERDANNQPRARSGAFATVYKATRPRGVGDVAIRLFTTASDDERRKRYAAISNYLRGRRVSSLVHFDYTDKGIKSAGDGKWYPLVTMEWVQGDVLFDWVRTQCARRNTRALEHAAERWVEIIRELNAAGIAHGDLQHGNVMVTPQGDLKLVDYDCMCVPELVGRRNLEIGVEPYQHPERGDRTELFLGIDNFSALFILVALRALAAAPQLWAGYIEPPHDKPYDKLLFRKEDFDAPQRSRLFQELQRSPDPKVGPLAKQLFDLVHVPLKSVPPLEHFVSDFETVRQLLHQKSFPEALELLKRNGSVEPPADLKPAIREAHERVKCLAALQAAVQAGDEEAIRQRYIPRLLDDFPQAQPLVAAARKTGQVVPVLQALQAAVEGQAVRQLVQIWDAHRTLLAGRASAEPYRLLAEDWRARNALCDAILTALGQEACEVGHLQSDWETLQRRGGHPECDDQRPLVERLVVRHLALAKLLKIPATAGENRDRALLAAWNESLFAGWNRAERERPRVMAANQRLAQLKLLAGLVEQSAAVVSFPGEKAILETAAKLPDGYRHALRPRVRQAQRRLAALQNLLRAHQQSPPSEAALAECWRTLVGLEGQNLILPQDHPRLELAAARAPLVQSLAGLSPQWPLDRLDRELLAVWNDEVLADCPETASWKQAYHDARERQCLLQTLERAMAQRDNAAIARCLESPLLKAYPFSATTADINQKALRRVRGAQELIAALQSQETARLRELFDVRVLRDDPGMFAPYQPLLSRWLESEILPRAKNGLKLPLVGAPLVVLPESKAYKVQWNWPAPRFTEQCVLKICHTPPEGSASPEQVEGFTISIDRKSYDGLGHRVIHPKPAWQGAYVCVWAAIDLGFRKYYSEPLLLGRLGTTAGGNGHAH